MVSLQADEIMRLHIKLGAIEIVGPTGSGRLQVIPIIGGTFSGEKINGKVAPRGADWNTTRQEGIAHVLAKFLLETDDGEFIAIENEGLIDPSLESVIKTKATFMANNDGKYSYLNHGIYVGELAGTPNAKDSVEIVIYKMC
ncbi:MAG TPA: DUF3237 domain-containing protein [Anaerolineales bacterium]